MLYEYIACVSCIQLKADDVKYGSHSIANQEGSTLHGISPSHFVCYDNSHAETFRNISCVVTYREELRRMGRPVWVYLDLLGAEADTELTFMCKAYEEADHQQLDGSRNGELE